MTPLNVTFFPDCLESELCHFSRDPSTEIGVGGNKECHKGSIYGSEGQSKRVAITFFKARINNREIEILSKLSGLENRSVHLVTALGYTDNSIVFEECDCDLQLFQRNHPKLLSFNLRRIITGVLKAVTYLHGLNLVHRDIKDKNILITLLSNNSAHTVLADLGETIDCTDPEACRIVGTVSHLAPEIIKVLSQKQLFVPVETNLKALDVFATGIVIWKISLFKPLAEFLYNSPRGLSSNKEIPDDLAERFRIHYEEMQNYFLDEGAYNFLNMLDFSPDTRPTAECALKQFQGH